MSKTVNKKDALIEEQKRVSISSKRQMTIPQKFFKALQFTDKAECFVRGNELIIRPVHRVVDNAIVVDENGVPIKSDEEE